jgi:hypothetical protein
VSVTWYLEGGIATTATRFAAVACAATVTGSRCTVASWARDDTDELVYVRCVNRFGVPAGSDFYLGFTW